jgi:hypothetical protein
MSTQGAPASASDLLAHGHVSGVGHGSPPQDVPQGDGLRG